MKNPFSRDEPSHLTNKGPLLRPLLPPFC
ncbi:MAG: hypothetical protein JWN34_1604, partial [Bryobacterales bacterium]|nr:hypothetical protein [Bryobacterales bacterium]